MAESAMKRHNLSGSSDNSEGDPGSQMSSSREPVYTRQSEQFRRESEVLETKITMEEAITTNRFQESVLHYAAEHGNTATVRAVIKDGTGTNPKDKFGAVPLHWAARRGLPEMTNELIKKGGDVNARNTDGSTRLHRSVRWDTPADVQALIEAKESTNATDKYGRTALQIAAMKDNPKMIRLLKKAGSDPNMRDEDGMTALHIAAKGGDPATIDALLQYEPDVVKNRLKLVFLNNNCQLSAQQIDQIRQKNSLHVDHSCDKSTAEPTCKTPVKVVLIGRKETGITSVLQALKTKQAVSSKPEDIPSGVEIDVDPAIYMYVYDLGGQNFHQPFITPGTVFTFIVDLKTFSKSILDTDLPKFYDEIVHRVATPVILIIGTKRDLCNQNDVDARETEILTKLEDLEDNKIRRLSERKRALEQALGEHSAQDQQTDYRFKMLSKEETEAKLKDVTNKLKPENRPKRPDKIIAVSNTNFEGIDDIYEALKNVVKSNPELFPCMPIQLAWHQVSRQLDQLAKTEPIIQQKRFVDICKQCGLEDEEWRSVLTFQCTIGRILKYDTEQNEDLNTVYINPRDITSALSCLFDMSYMTNEFWSSNRHTGDLVEIERTRIKDDLINCGIVNGAIIKCVLNNTTMCGKQVEVLALLKQLNMCYEISDGKQKALEKRSFRIPSLMIGSMSDERIHRASVFEDPSDCAANLNMVTDSDPVGLFDNVSCSIADVSKRRDAQKCVVASYPQHELLLEMTREVDIILAMQVRVDTKKIAFGSKKLRILSEEAHRAILHYPSIPFDWYLDCPTCIQTNVAYSNRGRRHAEDTLFKIDLPVIHEQYKCPSCDKEIKIYNGVLIDKEKYAAMRKRNYHSLYLQVGRNITRDWKFLGRLLYALNDNAEVAIEKARSVDPTNLQNCAFELMNNWGHSYDKDDKYECLIYAVFHLKKSILDEAAIDKEQIEAAERHERISGKDRGEKEKLERLMVITCIYIGGETSRLIKRLHPAADIASPSLEQNDPSERAYVSLRRWQKECEDEATYTRFICALKTEKLDHILKEAGIELER